MVKDRSNTNTVKYGLFAVWWVETDIRHKVDNKVINKVAHTSSVPYIRQVRGDFFPFFLNVYWWNLWLFLNKNILISATRKEGGKRGKAEGHRTCNLAVPGSNPPFCHEMDLSLVAPNSTSPSFVNSQLVRLLPLGILVQKTKRNIMFIYSGLFALALKNPFRGVVDIFYSLF